MRKLSEDTIGKSDIDRLITWLGTYPQLTQGKVTREFEQMWADWLGTKYVVFVNSGSSANLLMIYSLMQLGYIERGDQVVVPALSWSTDLSPVIQLGLEPLLCDCNLDNLAVDTSDVERLFDTYHPKVLILVSVLGLVPDMQEIISLCKRYNVVLIEDVCESIGSEYNNKKLGTFGLMSSFSTFFGHHISTIEGGIICTNNKKIYDMLKALRSHGWSRDLNNQEQKRLKSKWGVSNFNDLYTFYYPGFNLRSTDLQAFIGLGQLDKINDIINKREHNYNLYNKHIHNDYWKPSVYDNRYVSNFAYPIIHPKKKEIVDELR
ncbi:hypothetical protein LCGC14_3120300, partial [marine sediment metagenome]